METKSTRDYSIDIVKIFAAFAVVSIHFLFNNGFYSQTEQGMKMFAGGMMYAVFSSCVPLFLMATGYLMGGKTLSKRYYFKLLDVILVYVLASLVCMLGRVYFFYEVFTPKKIIEGILNFSLAPYSWYVEMYIGLFLLIPFLNLIYNGLDTRNKKLALIAVLFVLTTLPTVLNYFNFESLEWWANISSSESYQKIVPNYWVDFYPLTYYFLGRFFKEYKINIKTRALLMMLIGTVFLSAVYIFYRRHGATPYVEQYLYWNGIVPFSVTIFIFLLLIRVKTDKVPEPCKKLIAKVSSLTLGTYLVSYIFDKRFYDKLYQSTDRFTDRMPYYIIYVPAIFICSVVTAYIISLVAALIKYLCQKTYEFIKKPEKKLDNMTIAFIILMVIAVIISFWKSKFGFGGNDEAFYLSIPHRLSLGDSMFKDEWHLSQMSGFITLPIVWLYRLIAGSFTSIILFMRRLYIICHLAAAVFAYFRLKKYGWMSVFASLSYFIFTPFNIMALSYNTMALDLILVSMLLIATAKNKKKAEYIISGVLFAGAVLCCPYLVSLYIIFAVGVLINVIAKKKDGLFDGKKFAFFTLGVSILAVIFLAFFFKGAGINDIKANLPLMLDDPEHVQVGLLLRIKVLSYYFYTNHRYFKFSLLFYALMLIAMAADRRRRENRAVYITISAVISFATLLMYLPEIRYTTYNSIMFPFIFVGFTAYLLCERKPKKLFAAVFMSGIVYALCVSNSSNQFFYVISMAMAITNVAGAVFVGELFAEMKENKEKSSYKYAAEMIAAGALVCVLMLLMTSQLISKTKHCFWEPYGIESLSVRIENGPAKGIYTTEENAYEYEQTYKDMNLFSVYEPGNILVMSEKTWCYLVLDDFGYGTFSAWLSGENDYALERLKTYYEINPEKVPEYVYIPYKAGWNVDELVNEFTGNGYQLYYGNEGYRLVKE